MKNNSLPLFAALVLAIGCIAPRVAFAECYYRKQFADKGIKVVNVGTLTVPPNLTVGSIIQSTNLPDIWLEVAYCTAPGGAMTYVSTILWGDLVAGTDRVYSTNIPGIGYRIRAPGGAWIKSFPGTFNHTFDTGIENESNIWGAGWGFIFDLIKIAPRVGNGPLDHVPFARVDSAKGPSEPYFIMQIGDIRILAPSCQVGVGSRNQTVNLGQEFRNRFRGVGSTTASKDFQVVVNCYASPNGIENTVSLTMDATRDASNAPGVLGIDTGTGTASGVGIQVLDKDGQPVAFGQPKQLGQSKDGDYVVPFKARYYQVAGVVSNGKADGRATVTLSYK
ncbi:fimbrial protein [Acinetobacter guillouiae]|uniref:fimbrial protein n=1 Tax=Acinetobacter guillouiae TaxID=106649 RepID=UPI002FDA4AEC